MTSPFGQGVAFPMVVDGAGRLRWSHGERNIEESIGLILKTQQGERVGLAPFGAGLGSFLFEPNNAATHARVADAIATALKRWEPRIAVEQVDVEPSRRASETAVATILYRLVATGQQSRLALDISLGGA